MVDVWTETLAAIALLGSGIAIVVAWWESAQLRSTREQLAELQEQSREQAEKVERLGGVVAALRATIETKIQKLQISALERQVEMATAALKKQDAPVELPRIRSIPGSPNTATTVPPMPVEIGDNPTGALGRFRSWAGWGRPPVGQDPGKRARKGPGL